jgi:hypothetical protein
MSLKSHGVKKESRRFREALLAFRQHNALRHSIFCIAVVLLYLVLSLPEVIMLPRLGFTVWYPATGLMLALMVGISPWYMLLAIFASTLAGALIYHQPVLSWSGLAASILESGSYALAASFLRGSLKIDPALRQRRDVLRVKRLIANGRQTRKRCGFHRGIGPLKSTYRTSVGSYAGRSIPLTELRSRQAKVCF